MSKKRNEMVPAHERLGEPEHKARALECGSLLTPCIITNYFKAQASLRTPRRPSGALAAKTMPPSFAPVAIWQVAGRPA